MLDLHTGLTQFRMKIMDANEFIQKVRLAKPGQTVRVTFNPGSSSILSLRRLKSYCKPGGPNIAGKEYDVVMAILDAWDWENDQNRTIGFVDLPELDNQ